MKKTVLITGASRGIGAATARKFAHEGWNVAVNYHISKEKALTLCDEIGAFPIHADVSDPAQVKAMVEAVAERFGTMDALVCNAGISLPGGLLQDCTDEDWDRVFSVNTNGVFYAVRAVLPYMVRQQSGSIVTVSSMWGQVGGSCETAYSAAKGAVIAFTKALAKEVGPSHINVNCVAPGVIQTDMMAFATPEIIDMLREETPLERIGQPEDVAEALYYLTSPAASFITGQVLGVNGGMVI